MQNQISGWQNINYQIHSHCQLTKKKKLIKNIRHKWVELQIKKKSNIRFIELIKYD